MTSFFQAGEPCDPTYRYTRDGSEDHHVRGRQVIGSLWQACSEYIDSDAADKAMHDLLPVFWELHLANALRHVGKCIAPRAKRRYIKNEGPDLFVEGTPGVCIEAVTVQSGNVAYKLGGVAPEGVGTYDPDGVVLRLCSGISYKSHKMRRYLEKGIIKPDQAVVIAISGIALPYRYSGANPPEIVRAVYAVNNPVLEFETRTGKVTGSYVEHRERVKNANDADVGTDVFLSGEHSHISAVLFDDSDWTEYPDPPGANFKLVHNAGANVPLPDGWFPEGDEYWWRDGAVEIYHHTS